MPNQAKQFVQRAPRYILRPQDRADMRFSLEHTSGKGGIENTLLINLSESGVAFIMNRVHAPRIGDRIKVEVPIPQGERIAWWGNVVRTTLFEPSGWFKNDGFEGDPRVIVAIRFDELPEPHSRALRRGLNRSFMQTMRDQEFRTLRYYRGFFIEHFWKIVLYSFLSLMLVVTIYLLSQPSGNYDAKRGSQWGERFKFF